MSGRNIKTPREDNDQSEEPSENEQERAASVEQPPSGEGPFQVRVRIPLGSIHLPATEQAEMPQESILRNALRGAPRPYPILNNPSRYSTPERIEPHVAQTSSGAVRFSVPVSIDRSRISTPERTEPQEPPVPQISSGAVRFSVPVSIPHKKYMPESTDSEKSFQESLCRRPIHSSAPDGATESRRYHATGAFERIEPRASPARGLGTDGQLRESQPRTDPQLRVGSSKFRVRRVEEPSRWTSVKNFFGARIPRRFRSYRCLFTIAIVLLFALAGLLSLFILYMYSLQGVVLETRRSFPHDET